MAKFIKDNFSIILWTEKAFIKLLKDKSIKDLINKIKNMAQEFFIIMKIIIIKVNLEMD
jgi:hypothetical protein